MPEVSASGGHEAPPDKSKTMISWCRAHLWVPTTKHFDEFLRLVWKRYTGIDGLKTQGTIQAGGDDRALAYLERIIDRQLNKVRGLLSTNGILIAVSHFQPDSGAFYVLAQSFLLVSCGLCLKMFFVQWDRDLNTYGAISSELPNSMMVIAKRSRIITASVWLSFAGLIALAFALIGPNIRDILHQLDRKTVDGHPSVTDAAAPSYDGRD